MLGGIFSALAQAAEGIRHFGAGMKRLGDVAHASADQAEAWVAVNRTPSLASEVPVHQVSDESVKQARQKPSKTS